MIKILIMGKIKIILDKRRKLDDGTYPVKLYCNIPNKGNLIISTNIYINEDCIIGNTIINHRNAEIYNAILTAKFFKMEDILLKMKLNKTLQTTSLEDISKTIREALSDYDVKEIPSFLEMSEKFIESKDKTKTKDACRYMLHHLQNICKIDKLQFADITVKFLSNLDKTLKDEYNLQTNTRSIIFRNIRAVFNYAISEGVINYDCYPFRKFKIKNEKTRKRNLTIEQVRQLISLNPDTPEKTKMRDIFMLMMYLIGINTKDLLDAKEIVNGRIEYKRAKTGRLYSIKVEPEAMAIIERYKGKDTLLDIPYPTHFNNHFGKTLKKLGVDDKISSYYARHTWATFAAELEIPKETIAAALGHGGNSVTDIYIDFNQNKVDEANRKVIDYILNKQK